MSIIRCKDIKDAEKRHQCFRKKCFREIYDYNARAIVKTRFPQENVINYYTIKRKFKNLKTYEDILNSYYNWLKFSELRDDLFKCLTPFGNESACKYAATFGEYFAVASGDKIIIYKNFEEDHSIDLSLSATTVEEMKFVYHVDKYDNSHLYLVAINDSGTMQAWDMDKKTTNTPALRADDPKDKYSNLCYGTARNFYSSDNITINKYKIELGKMKIESSIDLPINRAPKKPKVKGMKTISEEIVALDSNDMNIYAVTCRVDQNEDSKENMVYLERYVCEDFLLICTEGGIICDRKYAYEPLPQEFTSETKVYLTMEDFIICTCGKFIAVYDEPIHTWVVSELIDDYNYVETLIVHVNLLLVGFNNGQIFGYDVSITQSLVKPNFFNGAKFKIHEITEPIIAFNVLEQPISKDPLSAEYKIPEDVYYPYIVITSKRNTHYFRFTEKYARHYLDSVKNPPAAVLTCGDKSNDNFTFIPV